MKRALVPTARPRGPRPLRRAAGAALLGLAVFAGCGGAARAPKSGSDLPATCAPEAEGLGTHTRKITTSSVEAQRCFDRGLAFLFGFNHDEAIRSFERTAELDPRAAMAHWGIALANGMHINSPVVDEPHAAAAWAALTRARALAPAATEPERALIDAVSKRYANPSPTDRKPLDQAYADAMRAVWRAHPDDADIGVLFAEALMNLRPWDLWTPDGKPQPGAEEIIAILEGVLARHPLHPHANHLYIHALEMSPTPEKARVSADRMRDTQPGLGHMLHMPSHIDVRLGRWEAAFVSSEKAVAADDAYRPRAPRLGYYQGYMAHNRQMLAYAAMMVGQSEKAIRAAREMVAALPAEWVREWAFLADGLVAMPFEVLMRFGRWEDILAVPEPHESLPLARALRLFARGVAYGARGELRLARAEQTSFLASAARVPKEAFFGNAAAAELLAVAEHLLAGELLAHEGKLDDAIVELREAVRREDTLRYDEPPDWMLPVRHALGAALLRAGRAAEAEAVYRDDLKRLPDNGWSLFGLAKALRAQKKDGEAADVEARFKAAWRQADFALSSSCLCLPGT